MVVSLEQPVNWVTVCIHYMAGHGVARIFMPYAGGVLAYPDKCAEVATQGYAGLMLSCGPRG